MWVPRLIIIIIIIPNYSFLFTISLNQAKIVLDFSLTFFLLHVYFSFSRIWNRKLWRTIFVIHFNGVFGSLSFWMLKKNLLKKTPQYTTIDRKHREFGFHFPPYIHRSVMIKLFVTNAIAWCVYTAEHAKKTTENHFSGFRLIDNH